MLRGMGTMGGTWPGSCPRIEDAEIDPAQLTHHAGTLEVRLAAGVDIVRAQALRHAIFVEEMGARPTGGSSAGGASLDRDHYDEFCDHLVVIDHALPGLPVVGTYRLLRERVAMQVGGFYSAGEYDLEPLLRHGLAAGMGTQLLELGRSCVAPAYRNHATISLLWRAIAAYLEAHRIGFLFGCASFGGTDPRVHADSLAYLKRFHLAAAEIRVRTLAHHHVEMDEGAVTGDLTGRELPPLIKGYLRVGAKVGDGAFIDHDFNTVDVFMVMPVEHIVGRYGRRFGLVQPPRSPHGG